MVDADAIMPPTSLGEFVLLVCGSVESVLVLPRMTTIHMLEGVGSRRIDVSLDNGIYVLQTTRHPKLDVTAYVNAYPAVAADSSEVLGVTDELDDAERPSRDHVRIQHSLTALGRAEGCTVWVPPNDRALSFRGEAFADLTQARLPNFGFDEYTRRIIQNIDVLWLDKNVIRKAFEIESTTSIYSGLLRMNDLVLAQPNNQIELFIAAKRARRPRVFEQLSRPTFRPLMTNCRFVAFEDIDDAASRVEKLGLEQGGRVSGLLVSEGFALPDHVLYPSGA